MSVPVISPLEDATVDSTQLSETTSHCFSLQSTQLSRPPSGLRSPPLVANNASLVKKPTPPAPKKVPLIPKKGATSIRRPQYIKSDRMSADEIEQFKKSERQLLNDETIKGESTFLKRLEEYRGKRLQRICYCESSCSARVKEIWTGSYYQLKKYFRGAKVVCCPPLCTIPKRIGFWPPPRAYFFFRPTENVTRRIPSDHKERVKEIVARKKTYHKLKKANRKSMDGTWQIGISHPCMEDVADAEGFVLETSRGNFIGCVKISCGSEPRFFIIYSHPSGSDLSDHLVGVPNLMDMARFYRCVIYCYDYSGYGISTGSPTEANQNADIRAVYKHLTETKQIPPLKIVIMGYSIGTSASVDLISELQDPPCGLVLEAPPLSILRVLTWNRACFGEPWKTKTCCLDRFSTFDKIGHINIPVLVIHGTQDQMVPFKHGKLVYEKAPMAVEPCWMEHVDHNTLENYIEVWKRIRLFLKEEVRGAASTPKNVIISKKNTPDRKEKRCEMPPKENTKNNIEDRKAKKQKSKKEVPYLGERDKKTI